MPPVGHTQSQHRVCPDLNSAVEFQRSGVIDELDEDVVACTVHKFRDCVPTDDMFIQQNEEMALACRPVV